MKQLIKPIISSSTMLGKGNCFSLLLSDEPFAETKIVNLSRAPDLGGAEIFL